MNKHHIDDMVKGLVEAGLVPTERADEVAAVLGGCWADRVALVWEADDVIEEAPGLTDGQAREVLRAVLARHDASVGVNWDVIRGVASTLYGDSVLEADGEDEENNGNGDRVG